MIQAMKTLTCFGAFLVLTSTNPLSATLQVSDSVIWQEGIVYSTPDGEALASYKVSHSQRSK